MAQVIIKSFTLKNVDIKRIKAASALVKRANAETTFSSCFQFVYSSECFLDTTFDGHRQQFQVPPIDKLTNIVLRLFLMRVELVRHIDSLTPLPTVYATSPLSSDKSTHLHQDPSRIQTGHCANEKRRRTKMRSM